MLDCCMATSFVGELRLTWPQVQYRLGTECNGLSLFSSLSEGDGRTEPSSCCEMLHGLIYKTRRLHS